MKKDNKKIIVLIDDEEIFGRNFSKFLRDRGYDARYYSRPESSIELECGEFDLLMIDNEINGFQNGEVVIEYVKEKYPNKPIISISGYDRKIPGANVHLVKPIHLEETIGLIKKLLT